MCAPEPIRHPAWCNLAACTVGQELVGLHWSRPWRIEPAGLVGYPLVELRLSLDGDQPVGEPAAVELRLTLWGGRPAVARYDVDPSMLLALAAAAVDVARVAGEPDASGTPALAAPGGVW
jgi:hypothetical protein